MRATRKIVIAAVVAVASIAVAVASADTLSGTAGAGGGGTKTKPVPNAPYYSVTESGPSAGSRPATPTTLISTWTGEQENGAGFATCTAAQIQAKLSTSVCPKGSLVATGSIHAQLGPVGNVTSNTNCVKNLSVYNSGGTKATLFISGPASACAGVAYLPPAPMSWSNAGGNATLTFPIPQNISHPLPGLEGAISVDALKFVKTTAHGHGYLSGIGCGSSKARTFTFTAVASSLPGGKVTQTIPAGKC